MNVAVQIRGRPNLDDPWSRLPWVLPAGILLWLLLLLAFGVLLQGTGRQDEMLIPIDARILEIPPQTGGLQGGGGSPPPQSPPAVQEHPPVEQPQVVKPEPHPVVKKVASPPHVKPQDKQAAPPPVYQQHALKPAEAEAPAGAQSPAAGTSDAATSESGSGGGGSVASGTGGGIGTNTLGARATFAPEPKIPDDLREDVFETVAVAHFHVDFDGHATITLVKPTSNPRLNAMLLDTLKQWRFAPAVRNGVTIDSEFDVRLPIAVK
jgi:protein TonB